MLISGCTVRADSPVPVQRNAQRNRGESLTDSSVEGRDVLVRHGDQQSGAHEAAGHAREDHVPRPHDEGDEDGDDAADEEPAAVEGVDEDGL